jgi:hypothetical protein
LCPIAEVAERLASIRALALSHIDSNPNHDEEDDDGRKDRDSKERREVPLRRAEQERREAVAERTVRRQAEHEAGLDDKPSTKRAASSLAKAVSGAKIVDATKSAAAAAKSSARRLATKR